MPSKRKPSVSRKDALDALALTIANDSYILEGGTCGCLVCCETFPAKDVHDWAEHGDGRLSARCPVCGCCFVVPSRALGDKREAELHAMQEYLIAERPIDDNLGPLLFSYLTYASSHKPSEEMKRKEKNAFRYALEDLLEYGDIPDASALILETIRYRALLRGDFGFRRDAGEAASRLEIHPALFLDPDNLMLLIWSELSRAYCGQAPEVNPAATLLYVTDAVALNAPWATLALAYCYHYGIGMDDDNLVADTSLRIQASALLSMLAMFHDLQPVPYFYLFALWFQMAYDEKDYFSAILYGLIALHFDEVAKRLKDGYPGMEAIVKKIEKRLPEARERYGAGRFDWNLPFAYTGYVLADSLLSDDMDGFRLFDKTPHSIYAKTERPEADGSLEVICRFERSPLLVDTEAGKVLFEKKEGPCEIAFRFQDVVGVTVGEKADFDCFEIVTGSEGFDSYCFYRNGDRSDFALVVDVRYEENPVHGAGD